MNSFLKQPKELLKHFLQYGDRYSAVVEIPGIPTLIHFSFVEFMGWDEFIIEMDWYEFFS